MSRGREENTAWVETGGTAPPGKQPYEQATPENVIKGVMEREAGEESATQQMRAGQERAGGTGHLLHLWSVAVRETLYPAIDRQVTARLTPDQARRYMAEHARQAFHARMREAQLAGHDVAELVDRVTADSLDGARSISSVLHSRLAGLGLHPQHDATWAQRTPDGVPDLARELAEGLDDRVRELGVRHAERPDPWLARHLGVLDPAASPALRAEYERRAGIVASYREAAGITDPDRAIAPEPHEGNPELETARKASMRALEIRDETEYLRGLSRGELEARVQAGERAMAVSPPDTSADLRSAGQARADAWAQHADATAAGREDEAQGAADLARLMEARERALEPQAGRYEGWSADTAQVRDDAAKARAELARRGREPDMPPGGDGGAGGGGPQTQPGPEAGPGEAAWWAQFDSMQAAIDALLAREREQAEAARRPRTPEPRPEPTAEERAAAQAEARRVIGELRADGYLGGPDASPDSGADPQLSESVNVPDPARGPEAEAGAGDLDEADEAWRRETAAQAPEPEVRVPDELPERLPRSAAEWRLDNAKADREAAAAEAQARAKAQPDGPETAVQTEPQVLEPTPAVAAAEAPEPEPPEPPEPERAEAEVPEASEPEPDEEAARNVRLDALEARAAEAAERAQAERAEEEAGARDYADRQAARAAAGIDAEPDTDAGGWQAAVPAEEELEPG